MLPLSENKGLYCSPRSDFWCAHRIFLISEQRDLVNGRCSFVLWWKDPYLSISFFRSLMVAETLDLGLGLIWSSEQLNLMGLAYDIITLWRQPLGFNIFHCLDLTLTLIWGFLILRSGNTGRGEGVGGRRPTDGRSPPGVTRARNQKTR